MADNQGVVRQIKYQQTFRWLLMLRTFRVALGPKKLVLALAAVLLIACGDYLIEQSPFNVQTDSESPKQPAISISVWQLVLGADAEESSPTSPLVPHRGVSGTASQLLNRDSSWTDLALNWSHLLWRLVVWSVFGGLLTRIIALQLTQDSSENLAQTYAFVRPRFLAYLTGPCLPLLGVCALAIPAILIGGVTQWLGSFGEMLAGIAMGPLMLFNLIMLLVVIGSLLGWPLMITTVSVEGSDGFDGFSRAYSYIMNRPWLAGSYALFAVFYGTIVLTVAGFLVDGLFYLGTWSMGLGFGHDQFNTMVGDVRLPTSLWGCAGLVDQLADKAGDGNQSWFLYFWARFAQWLLIALQYAYFWAAVTGIYLLLRRADDAIATDEIYVPEDESDGIPLVGTAASDQPVIERPGPTPGSQDDQTGESADSAVSEQSSPSDGSTSSPGSDTSSSEDDGETEKPSDPKDSPSDE